MVRATADFLGAGCGRHRIKSLAGFDHCLFVPRLHQNCFQNYTCPTRSSDLMHTYNLRSLGFHFYRPISIAIAARS